jgi:hypothetical protein
VREVAFTLSRSLKELPLLVRDTRRLRNGRVMGELVCGLQLRGREEDGEFAELGRQGEVLGRETY